MSIEENPAITSISNPADRKKLRGMLEEIVEVMRKQEDNKLSIKVIKDEIKKNFDLSPKHASALAKAMYKDNYEEIRAGQSDFETLYELVVRGVKPVTAEFAEDSDE